MLRPQDRPCDHNTIPLSRRRFFIGPYVKFWRCIKCDLDFDEQWKSGAQILAEMENVQIDEDGRGWIGCHHVYLIQEEP